MQTSLRLLGSTLFPNHCNPGAARAGLPSSKLPSPALSVLVSVNHRWPKSFPLWDLVPFAHTPHPALTAPSVHFYFSLLFINMSTLLLNIKGFLRNSFHHICLGVIWMFRIKIKRHKNRFCWFMSPCCFQFPISMGRRNAGKKWGICFPHVSFVNFSTRCKSFIKSQSVGRYSSLFPQTYSLPTVPSAFSHLLQVVGAEF